jgi:hypothetical protein
VLGSQEGDLPGDDVSQLLLRSALEKVKELVLYAISEEYFEARNQLGLSIVG